MKKMTSLSERSEVILGTLSQYDLTFAPIKEWQDAKAKAFPWYFGNFVKLPRRRRQGLLRHRDH